MVMATRLDGFKTVLSKYIEDEPINAISRFRIPEGLGIPVTTPSGTWDHDTTSNRHTHTE